MVATLLISLREFLEAFLIIGVFLGISRKLHLRREKEIIAAALFGIGIAVSIPLLIYFIGSQSKHILTEDRAELLQAYIMIFSGAFIAYVILSLHKQFSLRRSRSIIETHQKLQQRAFDVSLFFLIAFFVIREGFEIGLFTATTSLFSQFVDNVTGLFLGLTIASIMGLLIALAYVRIPIHKIFKATEYLLIIIGGVYVVRGVTVLFDVYGNINLSFLFQSIIFLIYFVSLYYFFIKRKQKNSIQQP